MRLLIDYLEESAAYLRERREKLNKLEDQFKRIYDRDIKKEMAEIKLDMARKNSEIINQLLFNLEEFRALHKYFPDLLAVYMEDEHIGRVLTKKSWLLDFRNVPPQQAAAKLQELRSWRAQLRDAKGTLRGWVGQVEAKAFVATYPVLRGYMREDLYKDDAIEVIKKVDKILLREGWLLLISDSLIEIPLAKYMGRIHNLRYEEIKAKAHYNRTVGRGGTVAETTALRRLQEIQKKKKHYENAVVQILLSNPGYLKAIKKKKDWLSKDKSGALDQIARGITPHSLKERIWFNEMKKRLGGAEAAGKEAGPHAEEKAGPAQGEEAAAPEPAPPKKAARKKRAVPETEGNAPPAGEEAAEAKPQKKAGKKAGKKPKAAA